MVVRAVDAFWAIAEGRKMAAGIHQYLQAGKSAKHPVK